MVLASLALALADMKCHRNMVPVPKDQCNLFLKAKVQDILPAVKSVQLDDHMSKLLMLL